jgi:predicted transcriptional regulator
MHQLGRSVLVALQQTARAKATIQQPRLCVFIAGEPLSLISLVATSTNLKTKGATELTTASARTTHILTNRDTIAGDYIVIFEFERKVKETSAHIFAEHSRAPRHSTTYA